jgi:hypothetical protein
LHAGSGNDAVQAPVFFGNLGDEFVKVLRISDILLAVVQLTAPFWDKATLGLGVVLVRLGLAVKAVHLSTSLSYTFREGKAETASTTGYDEDLAGDVEGGEALAVLAAADVRGQSALGGCTPGLLCGLESGRGWVELPGGY